MHADPAKDSQRYAAILGRNVTRARKEAGIKKYWLGLMTGISRPQIGKIEKGVVNIRLDAIVRIADALGTTPAALLSEGESAAPRDGAPAAEPAGHAPL